MGCVYALQKFTAKHKKNGQYVHFEDVMSPHKSPTKFICKPSNHSLNISNISACDLADFLSLSATFIDSDTEITFNIDEIDIIKQLQDEMQIEQGLVSD